MEKKSGWHRYLEKKKAVGAATLKQKKTAVGTATMEPCSLHTPNFHCCGTRPAWRVALRDPSIEFCCVQTRDIYICHQLLASGRIKSRPLLLGTVMCGTSIELGHVLSHASLFAEIHHFVIASRLETVLCVSRKTFF